MKVLFVYTNINGFHEDCYSIGLASIVAITKVSGHETRVVIVRGKKEYVKVLDALGQFKPRVVGFSSVSSQFHFVKEIACLIKQKCPNVISVCGGIHPTINNACILETRDLDGIFVGESDFAFIEFLQKINDGEDYHNTDNFAFRDRDEKVVVNPRKPLVENLDVLPYPDRKTYPFAETLRMSGSAPFFFARGCPYVCTYCSNHAIAKVYGFHSNPTRYRSPELSIREIEGVLKEFSIQSLLISDDIFGINKKWRTEFLNLYKERIKVRFNCLLRVNVIDEEFVRLLKEAGCYRVSIGIESGNDYIRNKIMKRNMTREQIVKAFALLQKHKIETNALNIIGTPEETEEMIWDTIKLNREIRPTYSGVNIFYPYKGTELGDRCFNTGLVDEERYESFSLERRESVLNYPLGFRKRLVYYRKNWDRLIYPGNMKRRILNWMRGTTIWKYLRIFKRSIMSQIVRGKKSLPGERL